MTQKQKLWKLAAPIYKMLRLQGWDRRGAHDEAIREARYFLRVQGHRAKR